MSPGFPTDNPAVRKIELRKETARDGIKCTVSGWGSHEEKNLEYAVLHFMSYEKCRPKYENETRIIQPGMICADHFGKEVDSCSVSNNLFFT